MKNVGVYSSSGGINRGVIDGYEKKVGYRFPKKYKEMLSTNDFLRPELDSFEFQRDSVKDGRDVNFFGYLDDANSQSPDRIGEYLFDMAFLPIHVLPFGFSGNGDYICFDYRHDPKTCEPRIVLMLHDEYTEDVEGKPKMAIIDIAPNFEAFIDMLYKHEDEE